MHCTPTPACTAPACTAHPCTAPPRPHAPISEQATFLLPHAVSLSHAHVVEGGCRIVFDGLAWGGELPERAADFLTADSASDPDSDSDSPEGGLLRVFVGPLSVLSEEDEAPEEQGETDHP